MEFIDEILLGVSLRAAWERLEPLDQMPHYLPQVEEARWLDPGPARVGSLLGLQAHYAGRRFSLLLRLTELDPPRRLVLESEGEGRMGVSGGLEMDLSPHAAGTWLRRRLEIRFGNPLAALAARPLVGMFVTRELRDDTLAALQAHVERREST